jgi:hypothetical protein
MKRIIISGAALLACVPASLGLLGNASFSQNLPVSVPSQAFVLNEKGDLTPHLPSSDDKGGQKPHAEPGDHKGGLTPTTQPSDDKGGPRPHAEPGDDKGGLTPTTQPSDDKGGPRPHVAHGDDKGGLTPNVAPGDKGGLTPNVAPGDKGGLTPNVAPGDDKVSDTRPAKDDTFRQDMSKAIKD